MKEPHIRATVKAIQFMREHLGEDVTSSQMAEHVGYSPYHFSRMFKKATGISPRQYLSALRIESGKTTLLKESSLLLKVLIAIGFRSQGSFNTKFKQFVGVSPKKFRSLSGSLSANVKQLEHEDLSLMPSHDVGNPQIKCLIEAPTSFHGIIFVGLFPRPIPDQRPIVGTAITRKRTCSFSGVPPGTYYLLSAGIQWSLNIKDYFILDHALRGMHPTPIQIKENSELNVTVSLREPLPTDPPIVVNLPLLLFEQQKEK
ncbi:helix-turn-helix transcriptional regulator [Paenibacillus sp. KN14-4R]|uniref:helix-turn-helix transcriptional regulator n=1 Tax=Paenibacillus sp. KN14-4R TaxID=3445773 RepID=UPI003FA0D5C1